MKQLYLALETLRRSAKPIFLIGVLAFSSALFAQPVISSFAPKSGVAGTTVTITGSNFSPIADSNIVYFGAVKATVSAATTGSLTVTAPAGASYNPVTVTVSHLTALSRLPFVETFAGGGGVFDITSFAPRPNFPSGAGSSNPRSIVVIDLDGDGKPDLFVTNQANGTVSVFRNTSAPPVLSFAPKQDITVGPQCFGAIAADFDGDGKKDMVVTNFNGGLSSTMSIMRNTSTPGSISFAPKTDYVTGNGSTAVCADDIDGDGKPDVMVTSGGSGFISVFRNISPGPGNISFAAKIDLPSFYYSECTLSDLDGDGKPDLATANSASNSISVLRNISTPGNIAFAPGTSYTAGSFPGGIAAGDLDGDGKPDLAVSNYSAAFMSVFRNTSTPGTISFSAKQDFASPNQAFSVGISDINGDGQPDIITPADSPDVVSVFRNISSTGAISFASRQDYATGYGPPGTGQVDLDGDGQPDIAVGNGYANISILRNKINETIVTSFSPQSGMTGAAITIHGGRFTGATAVSFGGAPATAFTVLSDTVITATVGTGATGSITVTTPAGSDSLGTFTFIPKPKIRSFTPTSGVPGTIVQIKGTGLSGATAVSFGGTPAILSSSRNDSVIVVKVGTGSTGYVAVTTPAGTDSLAGFIYRISLIKSFTPASGSNGTAVTITGSNLGLITSVKFGGVPASSFTIVSDTMITAIVGGGASGPVMVTNPYYTDSLAGFTYIPPPAPHILSFSPDSATTGTVVVIYGTHFTGTAAVSFGGVAAGSFTVVSDSIVTATVGSGASGYVALSGSYGVDTLDGFTYFADNHQAMAVYPNPAPGYTIAKHPTSDHTSQIQVVDMQGTVLRTVIVPPHSGVTTRVPLTGLTRGIYKIIWTDGSSHSHQTIFVL